jgi:hypothetical protein
MAGAPAHHSPSSATKEDDHANENPILPAPKRTAQGEADWSEAAAAGKACLVDSAAI